MAGVLVQLIPKKLYDFTSLSVGFAESYLVTERIDISQFIDAVAILRVHSASAAGGTIKLQLYEDGYCLWDPQLKFLKTEGSLTIDSSTVAPKLLVFGQKMLGHYVALGIEGSRTSASALSAEISLDLCLRSPDDTVV